MWGFECELTSFCSFFVHDTITTFTASNRISGTHFIFVMAFWWTWKHWALWLCYEELTFAYLRTHKPWPSWGLYLWTMVRTWFPNVIKLVAVCCGDDEFFRRTQNQTLAARWIEMKLKNELCCQNERKSKERSHHLTIVNGPYLRRLVFVVCCCICFLYGLARSDTICVCVCVVEKSLRLSNFIKHFFFR